MTPSALGPRRPLAPALPLGGLEGTPMGLLGAFLTCWCPRVPQAVVGSVRGAARSLQRK